MCQDAINDNDRKIIRRKLIQNEGQNKILFYTFYTQQIVHSERISECPCMKIRVWHYFFVNI